MKITFKIILVFVCFSYLATSVFGEVEVNNTDSRFMQLSAAFGYVEGQRNSAVYIRDNFPDLSKQTQDAWITFKASPLGEGYLGLVPEIKFLLGDKWEEFRSNLNQELENVKFSPTHDEAETFVNEISSRAKGKMPETIRSVLLSANPRYQNNPESELKEGWKQDFRTKGHLKAKGMDFTVSMPLSWKGKEGSRPNIIQLFKSKAGHGNIACTLMVKKISDSASEDISETEAKAAFDQEQMRQLMPEGATFVEAKVMVLEGLPLGLLICDTVKQRMDVSLKMRMHQYVLRHGDSMIFIQFIIIKSPDENKSIEELHEQYSPLFKAITNSLVLNNKYK